MCSISYEVLESSPARFVEFYALNGGRVVADTMDVGEFYAGRLGTLHFMVSCTQIETVRVQAKIL